MIKIPKFIKIGGRQVPVKRLASSDCGGHGGSFSAWTGVIKIANDPDYPQDEIEVTLIHEILECLNARYEYNLSHPTIMSLAENLYQTLKDWGTNEIT